VHACARMGTPAVCLRRASCSLHCLEPRAEQIILSLLLMQGTCVVVLEPRGSGLNLKHMPVRLQRQCPRLLLACQHCLLLDLKLCMHMPECDFGSMGYLPDMPLIVNLLQNFVQHCSCARQLAFKSDSVILQLGDLHILSFALDLRVGFTHALLVASVLELSELQLPSNNVQIGSQQHWQRSCEPGGCSHVVGVTLGRNSP
jgi:hypothetical protein